MSVCPHDRAEHFIRRGHHMGRELKAAVLALCCLAGCSNTDTVGSKYAKKQTVQAVSGGLVTVSSIDDPTLVGTSLEIPPDALAADTEITVAEIQALTLPSGARAVGPGAEFGPPAAIFSHPATIVVPYVLASGEAVDGLAIQGLDSDGKTIHVSAGDLIIDPKAKTIGFSAARLIKYQPIWAPPSAGLCPPGEALCGCCGNGKCQPAGQPCPAIACPSSCAVDAGTGGGGGGGSCCPAGETFCGCGNVGSCIPAGQACPLLCPVGPPSPAATCCGPGKYLCGCGGQGTCISNTQACPLLCPVCAPGTAPSPCGCLPPGAVCQCGPNQPSTAPCQCNPTAAGTTPNGPVCVVDGGSPCPNPTDKLTPCGCLPPGAICAPPPPPVDGGMISSDGGTGSACAPTQQRCCNGQCVGAGSVCPQVCFVDGGSATVDGGVCSAGTLRCSNGKCVPAGQPCTP